MIPSSCKNKNNCFHPVTYGGRHDCFRFRNHSSSTSFVCHWKWMIPQYEADACVMLTSRNLQALSVPPHLPRGPHPYASPSPCDTRSPYSTGIPRRRSSQYSPRPWPTRHTACHRASLLSYRVGDTSIRTKWKTVHLVTEGFFMSQRIKGT